MAYDERLAERVRDEMVASVDVGDLVERKMFGGLAFMVRGNMACGIVGDELMVRVGPDAYDGALSQRHVREMDFTGRPMRGLVMIGGDGLRGRGLAKWVGKGLDFAGSLPSK